MDKIIKILAKYYPVFLKGLGGTMWLAGVTLLAGTVLGLLVAFLRMSKFKPLSGLTAIYIQILRGTPILLQLYFFWILLPKVLPFEMSDTACIIVALIINASAYIAEIVRAGIAAVDPGQWEAGRSIGLTEIHLMQKIIMPQAIKNILPALVNQFIACIKETSLASVFFIRELTTAYKTVQASTFLTIQPLLISGLIYLVVTTVLSFAAGRIEGRLKASD
ncbi:MAG: amino acid ABC transporter permease [Firmicutes bacterium]|jgi:polar amino acid transport system permease protein|nr:amino acid ABC transporter permease [Bacillota bacterium]MBQ2083630.1 amino acid ABC transporter permease [Bacillota bacterium]MBQ2147737.1 amino acid ABC transporter permease [Bacillota bacterium]MBQ2217630.1 amino acid ABC transporter permease [Bacillota bacterium]MBQ4004756.1 amino acid ABC transporter permease [Bacillota bacterium]